MGLIGQSEPSGTKEPSQANIQLPKDSMVRSWKLLCSSALEERIEVEDKRLCEGAWTTFYACTIFDIHFASSKYLNNPTTLHQQPRHEV